MTMPDQIAVWRPRREELRRPVYRSLAERYAAAIENGDVAAGARLPPHRELAHDLGLSVQTVSRAYDALGKLGLITGEVGRGSFVRAGARAPSTPWMRVGGDVIDCSLLTPVIGARQQAAFRAALEKAAESAPAEVFASFRPNAALEPHRLRAAQWLAERCGVAAPIERIVPTNGSTPAMATALASCAKPGDLILAEALCHHHLRFLCSVLGMRLRGVEIDGEGMSPEALDRACREQTVKVLAVLPNGAGPTAARTSEARRAELIAIARRHGLWIVENDSHGPLEPRRPPPLAALAPDRVLYVTGLSKCVAPGLRIGWLVAPPALAATARGRHLATDWMATPLVAQIASILIENGAAGELLDWQSDQFARRNRLAAERLCGVERAGAPHGMHIWLPLKGGWREDGFVSHAAARGVALAAGANFHADDRAASPAVRLCLGGAKNEAELGQAIDVVAQLLAEPAAPPLYAW